MKIVFCCTHTKPEPWLEALHAALPGALIEVWNPDARQADYAVVWAPPQEFFDQQTGLKAIFNIGAGVDALLRLKLPEGVPLIRMEDAGMALQMAEYVCHAVIRHFREFDAYGADIAQHRWSYRKPRSRADFPVGVMGLGILGERVAHALQQFDFPVMGWSRSARKLPGVRCFSGKTGLSDFLAATRILVCLLPLTEETEGILSHDTLSQLLPGGYLINVARGAHLVDADLLGLIGSGQMSGACLDVFRTEPLPADHAFWGCPDITVTPHTSARTLRQESVAQIAAKIRSLADGGPIAGLTGVVDTKKGY